MCEPVKLDGGLLESRAKVRIKRMFLLLSIVLMGVFACSSSKEKSEQPQTQDGSNSAVEAGQSDVLLVQENVLVEHDKSSCLWPQGTYGIEIGDTLQDIEGSVKDCQREPVTLRQAACGKRVIYINVAAAWHPPDQKVSSQLEVLQQRFKGKSFFMVQILVRDDQNQLPTSVFCRQRQQKQAFSFPVWIDPLETLFKYSSQNIKTPIHLILDKKRVIRLKNPKATIEQLSAQIQSLLSE
tara:strand:+ start:5986 stop:6702 length:717 start_codon:yes stop_codon:yes gene_type:complete